MFDNFTERARKIMSIARQEAQRLNSEFIGTEHILIAILDEGGGVGAKVLKSLGIELKRIRQEVEKLITPSTSPTVTLGQLPFSPRAKRAIELAGEEVHRIAVNTRNPDTKTLGTGALLLGVYKESESLAHQVLDKLGVDLDRLRAEVDRLEAQAVSDPKAARADVLAVAVPVGQGALATADDDETDFKVRIRLYKETDSGGPPGRKFLVADDKVYAEAETVTVSGVSRGKFVEVAKAIAERHGARIYSIET